MTRWRKAVGTGLGFCIGGPVGALFGYLIGRIVDDQRSAPALDSSLARCYEILKVSPTAEVEEIKTSYRTLVKQYHPDLRGPVDEKTAILLRKKTANINAAYSQIRKVRHF